MDNELFDILSYDESIISNTLEQHNSVKHNQAQQAQYHAKHSQLNHTHHRATPTLAKTLINTLTDISTALNTNRNESSRSNKKSCVEGFAVKKKCSCDDGSSIFTLDDKFILFLLFLYVIYCYIQHCNMVKIHEQLFILNNTKK